MLAMELIQRFNSNEMRKIVAYESRGESQGNMIYDFSIAQI
jgi:hypothetical protein